jgi:hypothetical protein
MVALTARPSVRPATSAALTMEDEPDLAVALLDLFFIIFFIATAWFRPYPQGTAS